MRVHDEFIPDEEFADVIERVPEVCVEVVLETDEGVLLAKRINEPAKGEWFWPGGRLYKGEELPDAARRVASEELGIDISLEGKIGVYSHFWDTSPLPGSPSRHTVNVVFHVRPETEPPGISLDDQHSDYRYVTEIESGLHPYVEQYLEDSDLVA